MDYGYYVNVFGGTKIGEGEFRRRSEEAEAVLGALIFPRLPEKLTGGEKELFLRAVCYEAEYRFDRGTEEGGVRAEKIGDYAVEYSGQKESGAVCVSGRSISPAAVNLLLSAGLMLRWV